MSTCVRAYTCNGNIIHVAAIIIVLKRVSFSGLLVECGQCLWGTCGLC